MTELEKIQRDIDTLDEESRRLMSELEKGDLNQAAFSETQIELATNTRKSQELTLKKNRLRGAVPSNG